MDGHESGGRATIFKESFNPDRLRIGDPEEISLRREKHSVPLPEGEVHCSDASHDPSRRATVLKLQNTQAAEDVAVEAVREALERQQSASTALVCNRTRVAIPLKSVRVTRQEEARLGSGGMILILIESEDL